MHHESLRGRKSSHDDTKQANEQGSKRSDKHTTPLSDSQRDQLLEINVDVGFLSSDGLSTDRGFTTPYREEVAIKQAMMRSARRTVMLIDHSKVEKDHLHRIAGVEEVDTIITGAELGDDAFFSLDESGATVVRA